MPSVPNAQPCTSNRPRPSLGAPLPISLRVKIENGNSKSCQPTKSSSKVTVQRSASSVVEPGLRLSRRSMNRRVPEPVPWSHSERPSLVDQSCGTQVLPAALSNAWMNPANDVTSMSSWSTRLGVPAAGRTGAGGVAGSERTTELPAPWNVQKPTRSTPLGQDMLGARPLSKSSMVRRTKVQ